MNIVQTKLPALLNADGYHCFGFVTCFHPVRSVPKGFEKENRTPKPYSSLSRIGIRWNSAVKRAGIRRRNPYHTPHTFACWLLSAGANPSFITNPMGHENAQRVYEIYATWIEALNSEQVAMLNPTLGLKWICPTGAPFDI
ncbi:hypothetical protein Ent638_2141 [Enterobacter sp. 638]|uniref:Tyr recombinase domain-containing protein n=1 Tax=Enterobacter sp. (strain 638) TaxID=399742 RepID=A0A9J9GGH1_ENT38|nr:hypothetical protein Ent638_2141 [Enterobacter sp. 638]